MKRHGKLAALAFVAAPLLTLAQQGEPGMGGMKMDPVKVNPSSMQKMDAMYPRTFVQEIEQHASSGTSAEPNSTPAPMLMEMKSNWMLMFHANIFITELQQTSPRGADKFFSTNWAMPMAQGQVGPGQLTLRAMFSLEPATVTGRRYPLLFQQGETAFGRPIADGQHPHDFMMELTALYDLPVGDRTLLSFYAAAVGDPAIGPTAYPHRASAAEDPVAPLGHHQEDSTHIADDVVTMAATRGKVRIEGSGFHGREPDELRWNLDSGRIDSWSTRLTLQPGKSWSGQYSYAHIVSPEALFPDEDQSRMTASVMYNRALANGNLASTAVWGRTRSAGGRSGSPIVEAKENSYLFESTLRFKKKNYIWTRLEDAGRSNELLTGEGPLPSGVAEEPVGHVQAYTFGYDRDIDLIAHVRSAFGVQATAYGVPRVLEPIYGRDPVSVAVFLRLRPFSGKER